MTAKVSRPSAIILLLGLVMTLAALSTPARVDAQKKKAADGVRSEMIVSTDWLAKHLSDKNVVVIHVAGDRKSFDDGHIPGARFLSTKEILITRNGVSNELPAVSDLQKTFEKLGIGDTGRVIIYGDNSGLLAARVFYTLDYLGHAGRAALLDGGLEKWKTEKREVSKVADGFQTATFTPRVNPSVIVEMARVRDLSWQSLSVPAPGVSLIDARPAANYTGDDAGGLQRPGHIPGAVSIYWMQNLVSSENPAMKPVIELKKMYSEAGLKPGDLVVTYCRTGMQASHAYFTAKYLGYNVTMYDGSMSEWVTSEANEVIKGKDRK